MNIKPLIKLNKNTPIIVQGITGRQGSFHAQKMLEFGTRVVAGVTPGKGGQTVEGVEVFNSVAEAIAKYPVEWSCLFVPPQFAKEASLEALQQGLNLVIITEHMPIHDTVEVVKFAQKNDLAVLGPNCPGLVKPGEIKIGIMPNQIFKKGVIGVVSRSGTLMYEAVNTLSENSIGQSLVSGVGGDPLIGFDFIDLLEFFEKDKQTKKIIMIGEIGGDSEERAAEYIKKNVKKPVWAFVAGKSAPIGQTMGHAGALITKTSGSAKAKERSLILANVKVINNLSEFVNILDRS